MVTETEFKDGVLLLAAHKRGDLWHGIEIDLTATQGEIRPLTEVIDIGIGFKDDPENDVTGTLWTKLTGEIAVLTDTKFKVLSLIPKLGVGLWYFDVQLTYPKPADALDEWVWTAFAGQWEITRDITPRSKGA